MMFHIAGDAQSILLADLGIFLTLMAMGKLLDKDRSPDRILFGAVTCLFIGTYVAWRYFDTLPPLQLTPRSLWPHLFFAFEAVAVTYTLASIVILARSVDRTEEADKAAMSLEASGDFPAVDVFICTYSEPINVLEKSIIAALAMDYPALTVFVCDDTRRQEVRDYCDAVGARYVTRPDNQHAKAGNLNNALRQSAEGRRPAPLILVLDADFAPQRHFLRRVVGFFADNRIGVVQTPQFYYNCDPIQHSLGLRNSFVDDQRVFFDVFQPAKDAVDCAFCVGTSFVVRRSAVEELGGFPHEALSEDMLLTYRLMEHGYVTRWLNERLSVGLSAEGLAEYITQRTRWCLGTIQIGLLRDGPLRGGKFSLRQRLHYLHGLLSWLAKPFIVFLLLAPPLYWFFGVPPFEADDLAFLSLGIPALLSFWIYSSWVSGRRTLPLFTEVTHSLVALPVTMTLIAALRNPFGKPFKVTDKGGDRSELVVHTKLAALFGGFAMAAAAGVLLTLFSSTAPTEIADRDLLNILWAGVAMVMSTMAFLVCFEQPRPFAEEPIRVDMTVAARGDGPARAVDLSRLSVERVVLSRGQDATALREILLPDAGWVGCYEDTERAGHLILEPDPAARRALIRAIFCEAPHNVAPTGRLASSLLATARYALWRSPPAV